MILHDDTNYILIMMVLHYVMVIFHYVVMKLCRYTLIFHHTVQKRIQKFFKGEGGGIWKILMKTYVD